MTTTMETSAVLLESRSIPSLAHMLAAGEILPAQQPAASAWTPEKSLAAAVLASALVEIRDHAGNPKRAALVAAELDWVHREDSDRLYAFRRVCDLLDLEASWVRAVVARWLAAGGGRRPLFTWRTAA